MHGHFVFRVPPRPSGGAVFLASLGCGGMTLLGFGLLFGFMWLVGSCSPEPRF